MRISGSKSGPKRPWDSGLDWGGVRGTSLLYTIIVQSGTTPTIQHWMTVRLHNTYVTIITDITPVMFRTRIDSDFATFTFYHKKIISWLQNTAGTRTKTSHMDQSSYAQCDHKILLSLLSTSPPNSKHPYHQSIHSSLNPRCINYPSNPWNTSRHFLTLSRCLIRLRISQYELQLWTLTARYNTPSMIGRECTSTPPFLALEGGAAQPLQYVACMQPASPSCQCGCIQDIARPSKRQSHHTLPTAITKGLGATKVCVFSYFMEMGHTCFATSPAKQEVIQMLCKLRNDQM